MSRQGSVATVSLVDLLRSPRRECLSPEQAAKIEALLIEKGVMKPTSEKKEGGK